MSTKATDAIVLQNLSLLAISEFLKIFDFENTEKRSKTIDQVLLRLNVTGQRENVFVMNK